MILVVPYTLKDIMNAMCTKCAFQYSPCYQILLKDTPKAMHSKSSAINFLSFPAASLASKQWQTNYREQTDVVVHRSSCKLQEINTVTNSTSSTIYGIIQCQQNTSAVDQRLAKIIVLLSNSFIMPCAKSTHHQKTATKTKQYPWHTKKLCPNVICFSSMIQIACFWQEYFFSLPYIPHIHSRGSRLSKLGLIYANKWQCFNWFWGDLTICCVYTCTLSNMQICCLFYVCVPNSSQV